MEMHTFNVGEKEFSAAKMNAFSAAKHLVKLKTLLDKGLAQELKQTPLLCYRESMRRPLKPSSCQSCATQWLLVLPMA